jgi:hypothetical protein
MAKKSAKSTDWVAIAQQKNQEIDAAESKYVTPLYWELGEALFSSRPNYPHGEFGKALDGWKISRRRATDSVSIYRNLTKEETGKLSQESAATLAREKARAKMNKAAVQPHTPAPLGSGMLPWECCAAKRYRAAEKHYYDELGKARAEEVLQRLDKGEKPVKPPKVVDPLKSLVKRIKSRTARQLGTLVAPDVAQKAAEKMDEWLAEFGAG